MAFAHSFAQCFVFFKAPVAQFAGGAFFASFTRQPVVAGKGFVFYEVEYAEFVGERPFFGFCHVHERRYYFDRPFKGESHRSLLGLDEILAAVGISGEVRL